MVAVVPAMPIREAPEAAFAIYTALMIATTLAFFLWWVFSKERNFGQRFR